MFSNSAFIVNDKLVRQIEGCPMGNAIPVIISGIHMKRIQKDCVAHVIQNRTNLTLVTIEQKKLFSNMTCHQQNIKLIVETNPPRFLHAFFNVISTSSVITTVFQKPGKFLAVTSYERNNVTGDLHRVFKISNTTKKY